MRTKPTRLILSIVLVTLLLLLIVLGIKGWRLYKIARSLQGHQATAEQLAAGGVANINADQVGQLVNGIRSDVVDLKDETASLMFLTPYLGWVPTLGPLIVESPELLEIADAGTQALETVFPALAPAISVLNSAETDVNPISQLTDVIGNALPTFQQVSGDVERIQSAYDQIDNRDKMPAQAQQFFPLIDAYLPLADDGILATQLLPDLMGMNGAQTYLILVQNDDEVRATGGFISGLGTITVENGKIGDLLFEDAYQVDNVSQLDLYDYPPRPLEEFMGLQYFLFRDSNYWVDFPTSAEKAVELYTLGKPESPQITGVIALDQRFLELLINAIGPIEVPDLGTLTGTNVIETIRGAYNSGEDSDQLAEWWANRKAFMGVIASEIQRKIFEDPASIDPVKLLATIQEATAGRHFQVWFNSAESNKLVDQLGWSGVVDFSPNQDHLFVVDNNFGYNKVNVVMERSYSYAVNLNNNSATLDIQHQHLGENTSPECTHYNTYADESRYQAFIDQCYYNYQRILTPANSELINGSPSPVPAAWLVPGQEWLGETRTVEQPDPTQTVFDRFIVVRRGTIFLSKIDYTLPPTIVKSHSDLSQEYKLTVYKQGGMRSENVRIQVTLPLAAELVSTSPTDASVRGPIVTFDAVISADTDFIITYK